MASKRRNAPQFMRETAAQRNARKSTAPLPGMASAVQAQDEKAEASVEEKRVLDESKDRLKEMVSADRLLRETTDDELKVELCKRLQYLTDRYRADINELRGVYAE